jgi:hypothetical protein
MQAFVQEQARLMWDEFGQPYIVNDSPVEHGSVTPEDINPSDCKVSFHLQASMLRIMSPIGQIDDPWSISLDFTTLNRLNYSQWMSYFKHAPFKKATRDVPLHRSARPSKTTPKKCL